MMILFILRNTPFHYGSKFHFTASIDSWFSFNIIEFDIITTSTSICKWIVLLNSRVQYEKKGVALAAMKSAMKGKEMFDRASHQSTAKTKKEISKAHVTKASTPLQDNSLSKEGNDVQVNSTIEKEISIAHLIKASKPLLDNSISVDENHVELNSRVEKDNPLASASNNVKLNMMKENDDSSLNDSS